LHELYSLARTKKTVTCVSTGSTTAKTLTEKRLCVSTGSTTTKQTRTQILENLTLPKSDNAKENEMILQTQLT